jgi:hypothetical protein
VRAFRAVRPSPATVIASIALLVALAGTGYAATSLPKNSVGNAQLQSNAVTSSKVKDHGLLKVDFAANQLPRGARGAPGSPGPPGAPGNAGVAGARGPTGPAGGASSSLWAVVNLDGSLARGSGVVTVTHTAGTGIYKVQFNRNITQCAWLATIRTASFGFIETELSTGTTDSVRVETRDTTPAVADRAFHLGVLC